MEWDDDDDDDVRLPTRPRTKQQKCGWGKLKTRERERKVQRTRSHAQVVIAERFQRISPFLSLLRIQFFGYLSLSQSVGCR